MAETPQPRVPALDRPALGLVLQLVGLIALPAQLAMAAAVLLEDPTWSGISVLVTLQLVAAGLQIAAGIAIARRSSARLLFVAYAVATLAVAAGALIAFHADEATLVLDAGVLEILAGPVMILLAPLVIDVRGLADRRSPADVAAALFVLTVSSLLAMPLGIAGDARLVLGGRAPWSIFLNSGLMWGAGAAIAIIALRAGRIMLRPGPPAAARRALAIYVVVSIAVDVALRLLSIVALLLSSFRDHQALVLSTPVIGLVIAVLRPLAIWAYAGPVLREPIAVERRDMTGPLVWGVLWFAPLLVVRAGLLGELLPDSGTALAVVLGTLLCLQAIGNVAAARAASRNPGHGFRAAATATAIAVVLLAGVVVWLWVSLDLDSPAAFQFLPGRVAWPLTTLIALLTTLAWSQRGAPPGLPHAIVRHQ